ncbi:MAG: hydantoinase/oxoprolinase family protein [Deltaproteobacteria bacterium]|nr:hydantoinase/oxoprolinase family protein [Deltaproteobacteria bacterium]
MLLGIDVGGTHTDAVIIDHEGVVATAKVETDHNDLIASLDAVLEKILQSEPKRPIRKVNLSTTLTTNAIVEKELEEVGVLAVSGPGLAPAHFNQDLGQNFYLFAGSIDHRGALQQPLDKAATTQAINDCQTKKIKVFAVVSKFSTRNPEIEEAMAELVFEQSDFTTIGHRLSGHLNFPRRLATAYYNAAVWRRYNVFADAVGQSIRKHHLDAPLSILKADGGTIDFKNSRNHPIQTILSGPAASVMGIIALSSITEDAIILDIGGTTTDIAIFADGTPLLEKNGVSFGGRATSVRAINTNSIGVGGDSAITISSAGEIRVGPKRMGPPLALAGPQPTLIDVCNVKGLSALGDCRKSLIGLKALADKYGITIENITENALETALETIHGEALKLLEEINQRPVYTVAEVVHGAAIKPQKLYIMGGPAAILAPLLGRKFALPTEVPDNFAVANAIGTALTRTTMEIELFADTGKKLMFIPNLGIRKTIDNSYSLSQAQTYCINELVKYLNENGHPEITAADVSVVEAETFNMVDDYSAGSKSIRVSCQIRPGLETEYLQGIK